MDFEVSAFGISLSDPTVIVCPGPGQNRKKNNLGGQSWAGAKRGRLFVSSSQYLHMETLSMPVEVQGVNVLYLKEQSENEATTQGRVFVCVFCCSFFSFPSDKRPALFQPANPR